MAEARPAVGAAEAGAILEIDLGAIRANWRSLKRRLGTAVCAAVLKADAYGLGAEQVGHALKAQGCRTFFVAHLFEGVALRETLGAGVGIYVLNGLPPGTEDVAAAAQLMPVVNSLEQLAGWRAEAGRSGRPLPAALQVDSGMNRLGLAPGEVEAVAADPSLLAGIDTRLVMSHLAVAEDPKHPANAEQLRRFRSLCSKLPAAPASLANSSGIFLDPAYRFDLARPGAALYGINPTPSLPNPMRPVVRLSARVIQLRDVPAGEGVGYGHAYRATGALRTATIAIGYADGWHRRAASSAFLGTVPLPFVGRVSMDCVIVDVSALPAGQPAPGTLVELVGEHQSVDDVAGHAGTIGYEVLTGLGARFHRVYRDG